jgi:hypothetical protein
MGTTLRDNKPVHEGLAVDDSPLAKNTLETPEEKPSPEGLVGASDISLVSVARFILRPDWAITADRVYPPVAPTIAATNPASFATQTTKRVQPLASQRPRA